MIQNSTKTKVVGVDIGCETTTYAIVDIRGNILAKDRFSTAEHQNINEYVAVLCDKILSMVEANGGYESIRSMGVCTPSGNFTDGTIVNSHNLPWRGTIPLSAILRDQLGMATAVANNAHAKAMAEWTYGSAHGMRDFMLVTLGKGFGSCMFSNGHVHTGFNGFAGEIGHCCIEVDGRECTCGARGCLEAYCSEPGILRTAIELIEQTDKPSLMRDCKELTTDAIIDCCEKGDELAIEVYRKTGFLLGWGLANYASIADPEAIILVGEVTKAGKWLLEPANEIFEESVFHNVQGKIRLMFSALSEEEHGVLGASVMAWKVKEYSLFK